MTQVESIMLAVCFGAVMGTLIGNFIMMVRIAADNYKEKKRSREEKVNATHQSAE